MVAGEQRPAQPIFERADPRTHSGLGDVQIIGRTVEIAGGGDFKKGSDLVNMQKDTTFKTLRTFARVSDQWERCWRSR